jgi:hypothetical protein
MQLVRYDIPAGQNAYKRTSEFHLIVRGHSNICHRSATIPSPISLLIKPVQPRKPPISPNGTRRSGRPSRCRLPGTLVLDREGLSGLCRENRAVIALTQAAREEGVRVVTTAMTTLETDDEGVHPARVAWALSRIDVQEVTRAAADAARAAPAPVTVLTSDPADLTLLCGPGVGIVKV